MDSIILYDADGVIMNSLKAHGRLIFSYAGRFNVDIPSSVNGFKIKDESDVPAAMRSPMDAVFKDFGFPEYMISDLMKSYREDLASFGIEKYNGVLDYIERSDIPSGVVTSNYRTVVENFLEQEGYEGLFESIIGLEDVENPKPNPEPLHECIDLMDREFESVFVIGDSLSDMEAARNLDDEISPRVHAILVGWGYHEHGKETWKKHSDGFLSTEKDLQGLLNSLL